MSRRAPTRGGDAHESASTGRRRWVVVALTLVVGIVLLRITLSVSSGSQTFGVVGALLAATWLTGGVLAGPLPRRTRSPLRPARREIVGAVVCGAVAYVAFLAADLVAQQIAVLTHALSTLPKPEAITVLTIAIVVANGVGEEVFFRGALYSALARRRPVIVSTVIYVAVTVATLNVALVLAAAVMGTLFACQRRATRGVVVPIVTHVTWSVLMLCALPR